MIQKAIAEQLRGISGLVLPSSCAGHSGAMPLRHGMPVADSVATSELPFVGAQHAVPGAALRSCATRLCAVIPRADSARGISLRFAHSAVRSIEEGSLGAQNAFASG